MKAGTIAFDVPVTLVGGGALTREMLEEALVLAPGLVAADGAADRLAAWGHQPEAVIGDMDSIADLEAWRAGGAKVLHLEDQDSTDFEKCLSATEAPFYIGAGFTGRRVDHMLAVFHAMLARPAPPVFLLGEEEAIALLPPEQEVSLELAPGAVVSLFPLLPARGTVSKGLQWNVAGLQMAPGQQSGTSNRAVSGTVTVGVDAPGVLILVERVYLSALLGALSTPSLPSKLG